LRPYRYPIPKFLTITGGLAIGTSYGSHALLASFGYGSTVILGVVPSVIALFWLCFDRFMWRWKPLQLVGVSDLPNLNGKWCGNVHRLGESGKHEFTMVIEQTYTNIYVKTFTANSRSSSCATSFLVDDTGHNFELLNYWICKTRKRNTDDELMEDFKGFSHIDIKCSDGRISLEDYYFTDRNPPTRGRITLTRVDQ
jgi:hypothetical protein